MIGSSENVRGRSYYEEDTDQEHIREVYRTGANLDAKYEVMRRYGINEEPFEDWVLRRLALTLREKALDIGCGQGRFLLPVARFAKGKTGRVVGCDISEGVMSAVRGAATGEDLPVDLTVADAQALPFPRRASTS